MDLNKDVLQKQLEIIKNNTDGFVQGYAQALGWINSLIEKPVEAPVEAPK